MKLANEGIPITLAPRTINHIQPTNSFISYLLGYSEVLCMYQFALLRPVFRFKKVFITSSEIGVNLSLEKTMEIDQLSMVNTGDTNI